VAPVPRPLFWLHRHDDALTGALKAYICGFPLDEGQLALLRDYLRDWAEAMPAPGDLRCRIPSLVSRQALDRWLDDALDLGIDPL
jgi:hypothetical protein